VFGAARVAGADLFQIAGTAAEGLEFVYPFDPTRDDPGWLAFQERFAARYNAPVDQFSALGYDTTNILLDAICRAGLNRGAIRDALYGLESFHGVTGELIFDPNAKNVAPLFLGTVKEGQASYRRYPMDEPYASLNHKAVEYTGPPSEDATGPQFTIGLFGPQADKLAASLSPDGFRIIGIPSDAAWGKSSTELVNLVYQQQAFGLVATDRASAHLAEQIAVKTFLPVIAISADHKLTTTNIPWIFRLDPETPIARAVQYFSDAVSKVGPNRGRIREYLASGPFDSSGEAPTP
jgi:hypothetical protein